MAEINKMIQEFENRVALFLKNNSDTPEAVYQLNMQLFPVAGEVEGEKR